MPWSLSRETGERLEEMTSDSDCTITFPTLGLISAMERMAEKEGMSRKYAETAVDAMLKAIADALRRGETIIFPGFGTFSVKDRAEHQGWNLHTGEKMTVNARRVPVFKPSTALKNAVEGRNSTLKSVTAEQKWRNT